MNARNWLAAIALATALSTGLPTQATQLYKWVDEDGNVTYSQQKPNDRESETIQLRGATLSSDGAQEKLDALSDKANAGQGGREFAENSATATAERDKRLANNCKIAQENMRILRNTSRIQAKDDEGQAYYLDEDGIQAKIAESQKHIDENCQ